jgi:hypothetical protein
MTDVNSVPVPMRTYDLTNLTPQDVQIIGAGLSELPHKVVAGLLGKIQAQVSEQDEAARKAVEKKPSAKSA